MIIHANSICPQGHRRKMGFVERLPNNFLMLGWSSWTNLGGHPRSILMPDGSIVTGYYAHYFKDNLGANENHDVVSHCLRWSPPDDWPPAA